MPENYKYDIVIPFFNGLTYLADCVDSILKYTTRGTYRLLLANDASDCVTTEYAETLADQKGFILHYRSEVNRGFVKTCNDAISRGIADYVVLVNSDVVVTPNWLEGLGSQADNDGSIGLVNPLTNHASQINLKMSPGLSFLQMNAKCTFQNKNAACSGCWSPPRLFA